MKLVKDWLRKLLTTVVRKEIENVRIHVVHGHRSVPIYTISWLEVVYVNDKVLTSNVKESHTAMALGRQYTYENHNELTACINKMLDGR